MIQQAFISGQLAKAVYLDDGDYYVYQYDQAEPRGARPGEIEFLLSLRAEFRELSSDECALEDIRAQLVSEERNSTALFLSLSALDPALPTDTRVDARFAAEELLKDSKVAAFVGTRLLSRPAPAEHLPPEPQFDPKTPILSAIYKEVFDCQDTIEDVVACWQATLSHSIENLEETKRTNQSITDSGFLADVVRAVHAHAVLRVNDLVVNYALAPKVRRQIPQAALLLNHFKARLFESFPPTVAWSAPQVEARKDPGDRVDPFTELIYGYNYYDPSRKRSKLSVYDAVTRVKKQITAIRDLLFSGNVNLAEKFLHELLQFNLEHGERVHVGMTLCNLAGIALQANELEMAERLSDTALKLGIEDDPVIYVTHAEVLRWSARFPEALEEYAQIKVRFPSDHHGFCAYAEVLKDMGRFQDSLNAYKEAMGKWSDDPVARNGYAGVLGSMGRREEAADELKTTVRQFNDIVSRTAYAAVLSRLGRFGTGLTVAKGTIKQYPRDISGYLSYARTLRQAWMLDESLAAYETVADRFPDAAVGLSGKAEVLKRMGRLADALVIYDHVIENYPNNPLAKAGRAGILILLGSTEDAMKELANTRLFSEVDWRAHYLVSVSYLRAGNIETAISMMTRGYHTSPWQYVRTRFAMGLSVAMLRKRKAADAIRVLDRDVNMLDYGRRQQTVVLLGHAYAELGRSMVANSILRKVEGTQDRTVVELKEALISGYGLDTPGQSRAVPTDIWRRIESTELLLAVNA